MKIDKDMNQKIKCVIYDCDGVLFDSFEANQRLYNDLCIMVGRSPLNKVEVDYAHSHTVFEAIHYIFGNDGFVEQKVLELIRHVDLKKYVSLLKMEPHLLQTLNILKAAGVKRAINTNRTTSMKFIMEDFHLTPFFDIVVTALDVKNPKPHPESVEKIINILNVNKNETIFIGDSEIDLKTAVSAGVKFVSYKNKEIGNDYFIEDHLDLLNILF